MSTPKPGPYATVSDLDTTADYPPAPPASHGDTWVSSSRRKDKDGADDDPLRGYRDEVRILRESVAALTNQRDQLNSELGARANKLQVVEQLQQSKDSQYEHQERELAACKEEISALRQKLEAVTTSRDQLQSDLSALSGKLQRIEHPESESEKQFAQLEWQLRERDERIAALTEEMASRANQQFLETAEREDLQARLERARADISAMAQRRERQANGQSDAERERIWREASVAQHQEDLTHLQRRVTRHREDLQRAEAHRQVVQAMVWEREHMLDERDARLRTLQKEVDAQRSDHGKTLERANNQLAQALARSGAGERHFGEPFPAATVPVADAESRQRIGALEAQLAEGREALRQLQEQLQGAQHTNQALRDELAVAEGRLREAEEGSQHFEARPQSEVATHVPTPRSGQRLLVRTEGAAGIVHVLGRRTTIGRIPGNDLCVDSESVSRHHAVVLVGDNGTMIEDLNSTNGVFVNEVRVSRHELRPGDVVTIGKVRFRFVFKPDSDQH